jgi:hypothetical protein
LISVAKASNLFEAFVFFTIFGVFQIKYNIKFV